MTFWLWLDTYLHTGHGTSRGRDSTGDRAGGGVCPAWLCTSDQVSMSVILAKGEGWPLGPGERSLGCAMSVESSAYCESLCVRPFMFNIQFTPFIRWSLSISLESGSIMIRNKRAEMGHAILVLLRTRAAAGRAPRPAGLVGYGRPPVCREQKHDADRGGEGRRVRGRRPHGMPGSRRQKDCSMLTIDQHQHGRPVRRTRVVLHT